MRRGIALAIAVLMLGGAPECSAQAQQQDASANQSQPAAVQPTEYYRPCQGDDSDKHSDLCAQWQAATWTKWSFFASLIAAVGVVITLWFNLEAWRQARRAERGTEAALGHAERSANAAVKLAETAEQTAEAQLRAYVDFNGVNWVWENGADPAQDPPNGLNVCLKNYGRTPARKVLYTIKHWSTLDGRVLDVDATSIERLDSISPSDEMNLKGTGLIVSPVVWKAIKGGSAEFFSRLTVTYEDAFGRHHQVKADFRSTGEAEHLAITGTRESD